MKKFLTVLLVIAVMFTFSFSSAFATYSWEDGTFGLADAQAEATSYLNAYDISAFTGATYYTLQAVKSTAIASVTDAENVANVSAAVKDFENAVKAAKNLDTAIADATKTSYAQINEFVELVSQTNVASSTEIYLAGEAAKLAMDNATTVAGVEKALEDGIAKIKEIVLDVNEEYDFDKSELLNASLYVRTYADKVWKAFGNDAKHSEAVKSEYTALVNAAVAEAKAINSTVALNAFKVKYGLDPTTGKLAPASATTVSTLSFGAGYFAASHKNYIYHNAGAYLDNSKRDIVVYRSGYSVLAAKAMETKEAAVKKEVAKAALAELGAYDAEAINGDYSFATEAQIYVKNWTSASDFYDELNDAVDDGTFGAQLTAAVGTVDENAIASVKTGYVDSIVAAYAQFTKVEAAKKLASDTVFKYDDEDYSTANAKAVTSYQTAFVKELGNAKTVADVEALEDKYDAILDDIETKLEASKTNAIKAFNKVVDDAVAAVKADSTIKATMTSTAGIDEPGAIDAAAARLKEIAKGIVDAGTEPASFTNVSGFNAASKLNVLFDNAEGEFASLTSLLKGIGGDFSNANTKFATTMNYVYALPTATDLGYFDVPNLVYDAINNTALENTACTSIQTTTKIVQQIVSNWNAGVSKYDWTTVVAMRKAQLDQIAAYANTYSVYYPVLVEKADAKVAKLATPEKSDAFVKLLSDAETAIAAVNDWYEDTDDAGFDVSAMGYYDDTTYNAAVEAYAKLVYEAIEGTGSDTDAWVDFVAIETAVTVTYGSKLTSADQSAAATICAQAWAAKAAAKSDAAVNDAAETAIAALDALTLDTAKIAAEDAADAADLAALLAKAQSYFAYYEKANFTSAATTNLGLAKDIVNFYNFALDEEEAKAYVQDLAITARSAKTAKGNIKLTLNANVAPLKEAGYTVEYKFYRSTKARSGYKLMITKKTNTYTNTSGTKGVKYFYKAKLVVKDANGKVVATTPLTQCKYACRVK